jgi:hypothetical protein
MVGRAQGWGWRGKEAFGGSAGAPSTENTLSTSRLSIARSAVLRIAVQYVKVDLKAAVPPELVALDADFHAAGQLPEAAEFAVRV